MRTKAAGTTATATAEPLTATRLLRVREAADSLALPPASVYRLVRRGELSAIRIGRTIRIPERALAEFHSS
ncbi:MAG: helix-turn-helix domain-containing protein [Candidatus Nanopelagicales bacterium]